MLNLTFCTNTGADLGGVDWVASHPPLEYQKKKNIMTENKLKISSQRSGKLSQNTGNAISET